MLLAILLGICTVFIIILFYAHAREEKNLKEAEEKLNVSVDKFTGKVKRLQNLAQQQTETLNKIRKELGMVELTENVTSYTSNR